MLIEIRGAQFVNKGAELMLYAALQKLKEVYPSADFVMAPSNKQGPRPYAKRAELGFLQKAWIWRCGIQWGDLAALAPRKMREMYGIVLDKDIDIVIDISGFHYSDQWGFRSTKELADSSKRWRKYGTKVILLPQAMGPFKSTKIRKHIKIAVQNIDLVFARDSVSYQYLIEVIGEQPKVRMAPDFTNLIEGIVPDYFEVENNNYCLVPNYHMIDKTENGQGKAYLSIMIECARYLLEKGQRPFVLLHEDTANDLMLARRISECTGDDIAIIQESHPLKIKGILGVCKGTIGSRFHGLVSALSQGVPSLAIGWSHKYKTLLHEYGFDNWFLEVDTSFVDLHNKIDSIIDEDRRSEVTTKSSGIKRASEAMWDRALGVLS